VGQKQQGDNKKITYEYCTRTLHGNYSIIPSGNYLRKRPFSDEGGEGNNAIFILDQKELQKR
jgi:hypothetical protein